MRQTWRAVWLLALSACVGPDPDTPAPIEPLAIQDRVPIYVGHTENITAAPVVADVCGPTRDMIVTLLDRSRRFRVVADPRGAWRLDTAVELFADENVESTVVYAQQSGLIPMREARVGVLYRLLDPAGHAVDEGDVIGTAREQSQSLDLPTARSLNSAAYWNSAYGRATRAGLDELLRRMVDHT